MMGKVPAEGLTVSELLHLAFQVFYKRIKFTILALLQLFIPVYLQFHFRLYHMMLVTVKLDISGHKRITV